MMAVASDGHIIDILGSYLAYGKNNDAAILNKHLLKKEICISKWSDKNYIQMLDRGFTDYLDINNSVGLRPGSPYLWERDKNNILYLKLMHLG